jgi:hypothetical protein
VRRYRTYLRLSMASLVVGLAVGVGSWWYYMPPATAEYPETCATWNSSATSSQTVCSDAPGAQAESDLSSMLAHVHIVRMWTKDETVPVDPGDWPGFAVRNGLIAAGVTYLVLLLIVVPASVLRRPD